jgi:hypothetical protein
MYYVYNVCIIHIFQLQNEILLNYLKAIIIITGKNKSIIFINQSPNPD